MVRSRITPTPITPFLPLQRSLPASPARWCRRGGRWACPVPSACPASFCANGRTTPQHRRRHKRSQITDYTRHVYAHRHRHIEHTETHRNTNIQEKHTHAKTKIHRPKQTRQTHQRNTNIHTNETRRRTCANGTHKVCHMVSATATTTSAHLRVAQRGFRADRFVRSFVRSLVVPFNLFRSFAFVRLSDKKKSPGTHNQI